jgi:diguanylate cyclase (GGDEF)-like protein
VVTDQVQKILELTDDEMEVLVGDKKEFKTYINHVQRYSYGGEENIYIYKRYSEKFVRIEELYEHGKMFGIMIDVSDEIRKRMQIEAERDVDLLTGLYNRRGLENQLKRLFSEPGRIGHGAIIMLDADGLKEINDQYGHDNGDIYLRKIANIIKGFGVNESISSRQGGDEYVLVLYNYANEEELLKTIGVLEHIQNSSTVFLKEGLEVPLKFSFGYSLIGNRTDYLQMMHEADEKMYTSKRIRKGKKKS